MTELIDLSIAEAREGLKRKEYSATELAHETVRRLTEADAFRWLQKSAMDRRLSMREVADVVIREVTAE